jgi:hypothetical protein
MAAEELTTLDELRGKLAPIVHLATLQAASPAALAPLVQGLPQI